MTQLRPTGPRPTWGSMSKLGTATFAAQAMASLVIWQLVDDRSSVSASGIWSWSNSDFYQWRELSLATAGSIVVATGALTRRWPATLAAAAGCLLALLAGLAIFIGHAVSRSA